MRRTTQIAACSTVFALLASTSFAAEVNTFNQAPVGYAPTQVRPDLVVELGLGVGTAPVYEGSNVYGATISPIISLQRLNVPGLIDIGGDQSNAGGLTFAPSFTMNRERKSATYAPLNGLNDIEATYALGARVGYDMKFDDVFGAEAYGALRYAFGGAQGFIGEVGVDISAKLTPELTIVGGPVVAFASENYMDTYFGVTAAESAATGGRLAAYDPNGGIKSAGIQVAAKYEFVPDTFVNLNASYTRYVGSAENSPIVTSGSPDAYAVGVGLSRRFSINY